MNEKKISKLFIFLILFLLSSSAPVMGFSSTLNHIKEIPLPSISSDGNHTPLVQIADNGQLATVNYRNDPNFFVYNGKGSLLWNGTLSAE